MRTHIHYNFQRAHFIAGFMPFQIDFVRVFFFWNHFFHFFFSALEIVSSPANKSVSKLRSEPYLLRLRLSWCRFYGQVYFCCHACQCLECCGRPIQYLPQKENWTVDTIVTADTDLFKAVIYIKCTWQICDIRLALKFHNYTRCRYVFEINV